MPLYLPLTSISKHQRPSYCTYSAHSTHHCIQHQSSFKKRGIFDDLRKKLSTRKPSKYKLYLAPYLNYTSTYPETDFLPTSSNMNPFAPHREAPPAYTPGPTPQIVYAPGPAAPNTNTTSRTDSTFTDIEDFDDGASGSDVLVVQIAPVEEVNVDAVSIALLTNRCNSLRIWPVSFQGRPAMEPESSIRKTKSKDLRQAYRSKP